MNKRSIKTLTILASAVGLHGCVAASEGFQADSEDFGRAMSIQSTTKAKVLKAELELFKEAVRGNSGKTSNCYVIRKLKIEPVHGIYGSPGGHGGGGGDAGGNGGPEGGVKPNCRRP